MKSLLLQRAAGIKPRVRMNGVGKKVCDEVSFNIFNFFLRIILDEVIQYTMHEYDSLGIY